MKSILKKIASMAAVLGVSVYLSSNVQALGITETNRYGTMPNPFGLKDVYPQEVKNVDIYGNIIPTEGTDFTQYYWRGDHQEVSYDYDGRTTYIIHQTVRTWEAK